MHLHKFRTVGIHFDKTQV